MDKNTKKKHEEMLYTSVLIRTLTDECGSGTVVYSKPVKKGSEEYETYILTNYHVIEEAIEVKKEWSTTFQRDIKKEKRATIIVEFFKYKNLSRNIGRISLEADVVAYDKDQDFALIKLRSTESIKYIAKIHSKNVKDICIYDPVYACGCSLGHSPFPTKGEITSMDDEIERQKYWMSSAMIIDGSSGGSIFLIVTNEKGEEESYEFIGIPSMLETLSKSDNKKEKDKKEENKNEDNITHMCYLIPINRIYDWLEEICFQFIFDLKFTSEQCLKMREKKRKKIEEGNNQEEEEEKQLPEKEEEEEKQKDS